MRELSEAERGRAELLFVAATAISAELETIRDSFGLNCNTDALKAKTARRYQLQDLARKVTDAAFEIIVRNAPAEDCPCPTCTRARNA